MSEITKDGKLAHDTADLLRELSDYQQDINDLDDGAGWMNAMAINAALKLLNDHGLIEEMPPAPTS